MPLRTRPEDLPAAVRFSVEENGHALAVTCALLPHQENSSYRLGDTPVRFENRDAFKAKVVEVGMSPAVAEDQGRSFNATARQLQSLGFAAEIPDEKKDEKPKAA